MSQDEFWALTPHQYNGLVAEEIRATELEETRRRAMAWEMAYLTRVKDFPSWSVWVRGEAVAHPATDDDKAAHEERVRNLG